MAGHRLRLRRRFLPCEAVDNAVEPSGVRAGDLNGFFSTPVRGQDADLLEDQREELGVDRPAVAQRGTDPGVRRKAVEEDRQASEPEEPGLSGTKPEPSGVKLVRVAEVGLDVVPPVAEESADRKSFPRSTP